MPWATIGGQGTIHDPVVVELSGPGPFQFPMIENVARLEDNGRGSWVLQLETGRGSAVHLLLSAKALSALTGVVHCASTDTKPGC